MNIFLRVGQWVDKHFPEKITTTEVMEKFSGFSAHLINLEKELETKNDAIAFKTQCGDEFVVIRKVLEKLTADLETLKTNMAMKTRIVGSSPVTLTPFAQRLQPVQPANSSGGVTTGNK